MGLAHFQREDFLAAARAIAAEAGPARVTVDAVIEHMKAPKGSFYHRFASRDDLLGELWLSNINDYQKGFVAAVEAGDGLAAALHVPQWVREHLDDARLLLLYSRHDFVAGDWPPALVKGVRAQAKRIEGCIERIAQLNWGRVDDTTLRLAQFVVGDAPFAAVRPHLQKREAPPPLVDEIIRATYKSIVRLHT